MNRNELASEIFKIAYLKGDFLLRSGQKSNEYFDKYRFESNPRILKEVAKAMALLVPKGTEVLAGLEMGGIPLATALSFETGIPVSFVRKKAKEYGTQKFAEGIEIKGKKLLIIEDVVTSGGQVIESSRDLLNDGAQIIGVICVIDREQGGREKLKATGLELKSVFTMTDLKSSVK